MFLCQKISRLHLCLCPISSVSFVQLLFLYLITPGFPDGSADSIVNNFLFFLYANTFISLCVFIILTSVLGLSLLIILFQAEYPKFQTFQSYKNVRREANSEAQEIIATIAYKSHVFDIFMTNHKHQSHMHGPLLNDSVCRQS